MTLTVTALAVLPLAGCAGNGVNAFNVDAGNSLSVDAGQRVVLITHKGGKSGDRQVVCAEPAPDAAVALAATWSVNAAATGAGGSPQAGASVSAAAASREAVVAIGTRTQTIQLLRDGLFRACEAFMNGAIDQGQYTAILVNIDRVMITALGIDAIGALPASSGADAGSARPVQAEAVANIVLAAGARAVAPGECLTLLASGELRLDNPGQLTTLRRCDALLASEFDRLVKRPDVPVSRYRMTVPPTAAIAEPQNTSELKPAPLDPANTVGWAAVATAVPDGAIAAASAWDTTMERHVAGE